MQIKHQRFFFKEIYLCFEWRNLLSNSNQAWRSEIIRIFFFTAITRRMKNSIKESPEGNCFSTWVPRTSAIRVLDTASLTQRNWIQWKRKVGLGKMSLPMYVVNTMKFDPIKSFGECFSTGADFFFILIISLQLSKRTTVA